MNTYTTSRTARKITPWILFLFVLCLAIGFRVGNYFSTEAHELRQQLKSCKQRNENLIKGCKKCSEKAA